LRQARDEDKVKAVVLRVDSPGGEVFASEQIRREVDALKKAGKPVVVSMGDLAASGGYWISMDADRIYADPSTISGSIGIFGLVPNFTRTWTSWACTPMAWAPPSTPARST
jgi:protease-4